MTLMVTIHTSIYYISIDRNITTGPKLICKIIKQTICKSVDYQFFWFGVIRKKKTF
jgi:hypothetical protein